MILKYFHFYVYYGSVLYFLKIFPNIFIHEHVFLRIPLAINNIGLMVINNFPLGLVSFDLEIASSIDYAVCDYIILN